MYRVLVGLSQKLIIFTDEMHEVEAQPADVLIIEFLFEKLLSQLFEVLIAVLNTLKTVILI